MFNNVIILSIIVDKAAQIKTGPVIIGERNGKPQPRVSAGEPPPPTYFILPLLVINF
jgi:hypothetical protein